MTVPTIKRLTYDYLYVQMCVYNTLPVLLEHQKRPAQFWEATQYPTQRNGPLFLGGANRPWPTSDQWPLSGGGLNKCGNIHTLCCGSQRGHSWNTDTFYSAHQRQRRKAHLRVSGSRTDRCNPEKEAVVLTPPPPKKGHSMQKIDRVGIPRSKIQYNTK